jgi:hypothetical protein
MVFIFIVEKSKTGEIPHESNTITVGIIGDIADRVPDVVFAGTQEKRL